MNIVRLSALRWLLAIPLVIGCGTGQDSAHDRRSSITVAVAGIDDLVPDSTDADRLVFLSLARINAKGEWEGRLAIDWVDSPDFRERTYRLRRDVKWHDDVPVTAHDVKFSMDLWSHPDLQEYQFESTNVLDDYTVVVTAEGDDATRLPIFPKHLLADLDPRDFFEFEFWRRPIGNGPYQFVRHLPDTMVEFEANPDFYLGKPQIERVVLKFGAGFTDLLSGDVDAIKSGSPMHTYQATRDPRFRVYHSFARGGAIAIYWQQKNTLFQDVRVRRALTLAINRRELMQMADLPPDTPLYDGPVTERQFDQLPEPIPYDPSQARALLDAAGWKDSNGDGVRDQDGQEFCFTALAPTVQFFGLNQQLAVYVQSQLLRMGIHMEIQPIEQMSLWGRLRAGEFDAAFMIVQGGAHWYKNYFGAESPLGYENLEVEQLTIRALATADPDEKDRIYRRLMEIFQVDQPLTYLRTATQSYIVRRRVHGLSSPFAVDPLSAMETLWLEEDEP